MSQWVWDPSQYQEKNFEIIPAGDYRVRIEDVVERTYSSGNDGYEMTLAVNGYNSKMWLRLILDKSNPARTNQRIGEFFDSFGITTTSMGTGKQWIGKVGAIRVKHGEWNGNTRAEVAYCIARSKQDKLEPWKNGGVAAPVAEEVTIPDDLPFI